VLSAAPPGSDAQALAARTLSLAGVQLPDDVGRWCGSAPRDADAGVAGAHDVHP
jgi:hypothetical protein